MEDSILCTGSRSSYGMHCCHPGWGALSIYCCPCNCSCCFSSVATWLSSLSHFTWIVYPGILLSWKKLFTLEMKAGVGFYCSEWKPVYWILRSCMFSSLAVFIDFLYVPVCLLCSSCVPMCMLVSENNVCVARLSRELVQGLETLNNSVNWEPFLNRAPFLPGHMTSGQGGLLNTQTWPSDSTQWLCSYAYIVTDF